MKHIDEIELSEPQCRICKQPLIVGENCTLKRLEHSMYFCQPCERIEMKQRQMYVNGKYVPKSHPLHKAGNYKTFEDAAFSSFEKYESSTEGEVYIVSNPAWKDWFKVGMAIDADDRCKGYQTSSPFRDYRIEYRKEFKDRRSAESTAHRRLKRICNEYEGEWFYTNINKVIEVIESI